MTSLSTALLLHFQQEKVEEEEYRFKVATGNYTAGTSSQPQVKKIKYKKDGYFSDEEDIVDD